MRYDTKKQSGFMAIEWIIGIVVAITLAVLSHQVYRYHENQSNISSFETSINILVQDLRDKYKALNGDYLGLTPNAVDGLGMTPVGWRIDTTNNRWSSKLSSDTGLTAVNGNTQFNLSIVTTPENCPGIVESMIVTAETMVVGSTTVKDSTTQPTVDAIGNACNSTGIKLPPTTITISATFN